MKFFNYFACTEFFPNCSQSEITLCFKDGLFDNLLLLLQVVDNIRDYVEKPIYLTSTFRDVEHNARVGGVPTSQHMAASAIDFVCPKIPFETLVFLVVEFLQKSALERFVGQVIFYHKRQFIHIALRTPKHSKLTFLHYEKGND